MSGTLSDGFSSSDLTEKSKPAVAEVLEVLDENGDVLVTGVAAEDAKGVQGLASWSFNLVAGADFSAANQLSTNDSIGNVEIANNKGIRTGTGDINIAAVGDLKMLGAGSVIYTTGRNASPLAGFDAPPANLNPLYLTDGGDINIATKGNVIGGESTAGGRQLINQWLLRQGGGSDARDTTWWMRPDLFKQSTATLGGGDLTVNAGKDISNFSISAATTARYDTNGVTGNQVIDGGGDVKVSAGNNITNGVYFVAKGDGEISAGNEINQTNATFGTILALQDGKLTAYAGKNVFIETVVNPTLLAQSRTNDLTNSDSGVSSFFNTYSDNAKVAVTSLQGNVAFGKKPATNVSDKLADSKIPLITDGLRYMPSQVNVTAFNGDVEFGIDVANAPAVLLPSTSSDLKLLAAKNVKLGGVLMSDASLIGIGDIKTPLNQTNYKKFDVALKGHAPQLLHKNSTEPVLVVANQGDISPLNDSTEITLPKFARFVAGNDISALQLNIQNNNSSDISFIKAGNDVKTRTVNISGPGELLVQATRNIDLRSTAPTSMSAIGNRDNAALPSNGASITLQAGLGKGANVQGYIDQYILPTGSGPAVLKAKVVDLATYKLATAKSLTEYMRNTQKPDETPYTDATALAAFNTSSLENKTIFANRHVSTELVASALGFGKAGNHSRGDSALATLFPNKNPGDVLLPDSKITTNSGGSIDVLAPGGKIIVGAPGVANAGSGSEIGVITEKGGPIRMIADGNIDVNLSKVITQFGSDIVMWSNTGTIDAGKGAKSATSTPQRIVQTDAFGNTFVEVRGVATGSGIRAQSYDSDGPNGPELEPKKGNVYLVAPVVDAGEAGIEAGDLVIVAPIVLNAANIQVQGASSGVPIAATAGLSGVSAGLSPDAVNSATSAVTQSVSQAGNQQALVKPVLPSIVNVEVISIGDGSPERSRSNDKEEEESKKKKDKK